MTREQLVELARSKPVPPYTLDEQLTFFCPQENLEALDMDVVLDFHRWKLERPLPAGGDEPAVLLLMPCQKVKPYTLSREHRAINGALADAGFTPNGRGDWPEELAARAPEALLSNAPLVGRGLRIDRAVISEPFGVVPYDVIYRWHGRPAPFARYDDPGLFEHRGIAPTWRPDCTAATVEGRVRWGDSERAAFAAVHNRLSEQIGEVLERLAPAYAAIVAYLAPGLTHRSFLGDAAARKAAGLPTRRRAGGRQLELVGVGDTRPGLVTLVPDGRELALLRARRRGRLPADVLVRPDALALLVDRLEALIASTRRAA
jgi:hypothetical protein